MRLLLDTHVVLWWVANVRLTDEAREAISNPRSIVHVSAASAFEIATKTALGKLRAPDDLEAELQRHQFTSLAITVAHGLRAGRLPLHHRDPFDRILVAQAQAENLTLVTRNPRLAAYGIATLAA